MLLKNQRNTFFTSLSERGLSVEMFTEKITSSFYRITTKDSIYYFNVSPTISSSIIDGDFEINSLPKSAGSKWNNGYYWTEVVDCFNSWADAMREEAEAPDLWAEAAKTAQLFAPTSTPTDDKFTRTELAEVQGQLRLLQQSFTTAALPEAARQKLIEITVNVSIAAETQTKRDWLGIMVGSFTGAVFSLALNPTQAAEVIRLVKAAFGGLFLH